jgi:hypothetical protein
MSEENVEIVRGAMKPSTEATSPLWLGAIDPEVVIHENADFPDSLAFRGHAGAMKWLESVNELWEDAPPPSSNIPVRGRVRSRVVPCYRAGPRERRPGGCAGPPGLPYIR